MSVEIIKKPKASNFEELPVGSLFFFPETAHSVYLKLNNDNERNTVEVFSLKNNKPVDGIISRTNNWAVVSQVNVTQVKEV